MYNVTVSGCICWSDFLVLHWYLWWISGMQYRCLIRGRNCLPFTNTWFHRWFCGRIRVVHLYSFLCCVFCFVYLSSFCVLCTQCCQYLWFVHSLFPLPFFYVCFRNLPIFMIRRKNFEYAKSSNSKDRQCNVTKYKKTNNARQNMTQKTWATRTLLKTVLNSMLLKGKYQLLQ